MAPASSRAAPTPWAHRAASRKPNEPATPAASDDAANTTSPAAVRAAGPDAPAHERDQEGRHRDDDGVGRQDPRDADDAGVELPVEVGQRQHHDGGVGEGQAHGHHQERRERGRAGSPAVVGRGSRRGGDRGGQQGWRQRGAAREGGHEDLVDDGNRRPNAGPHRRGSPRRTPLGEFGAPGQPRSRPTLRCGRSDRSRQTGRMAEPLRTGTTAGRWVIAATVLGSGIAFLDGSVVNVALPTIGRDLDTDLAGLQWILDGYLVTLTGLLLLGGSLGDRYGRRRMFVIGLVAFTVASVLCALAPTATLAHPGPGPAGRRRRAAGAREPGDHLGVVPPRRPGPGRRRLVGAGRRGERGRSLRRRLAGPGMVVAADLPHQRAHRRRGRGHHAAPRARVERPP